MCSHGGVQLIYMPKFAPSRAGQSMDGKVMKVTRYFETLRTRPDRAFIKEEWIQYVVQFPEREQRQADGRLRRWARINDAEGRYLRVILLEDGITVHNAFFDRGFKP